ncbi:MAG: TonB-dependent receptor, partial [Candidatus Eremiobacteraeota bacterium]|nr:TonB-dependent receptor [Candidatus Eremiobacteraeota bacterium]
MISFSLAVAAVADAQSVTGTISGAVQDPAGAPVAGAQVRFSGESSATANTDSAGHFAVERPPGAYRLAVSKAGYQTATSDLVVVAGQNQPIAVVLQPATLASLKVVGSVVSHGGSFNTSPASSETISGQTFITQAQPQVMQVLNETPGIVASYPGGSANGAVPGAITFPNIRGALSFETASLIDGHPVSVGQFGDYVTTFLNPFVLGSIEVVKGPGAAAPETNFAIGGTVNFRTKDPTYKPQATMTLAADSFGGRFGNFGYSGTTADQKLGWVLDYAFQDTGGPFNNQPGMFVPNGATIGGNFIGFQDGANAAGYPPNVYRPSIPFNDTPIVACCQLIQSNYKNEAELAKLRYNFSPSTTATFTFLGTQTVADQTANNSQQTLYTFDPTTSGGFPPNTPPTPYTGPLHTGTVALQAPFFPGADIEHNNEPIFEGEVRTTAGKDSVIARAYTANIHRLVDQGGDNPATPITQSLALYGTIYDGNGNPVNTYNGEAVPVQFNAYFHQFELDALAGYSLEWDHPFATDDLVTVAYDHTHSSTYAGVGQFVFGNPNSFGISTNVPKGSSQDFGTLLVRGLINAGHKLSLTFANYFNSYKSTYAVGCVNPSSNPPNTCPANTPATPPPFLFATGNSSHYDGRFGVVYRPDPELAVRLAVGSAIAPPYLGLLSNVSLPPTYFGGDFATQQISGNNLQPETAFGYDIGAD